ncbi:hypothetical protein [Ruegeria lacuscaerulensis]|uniref:hypothetical protein n=1 Tax=Ruegeria lacuscaerulensis TaxID=55218 RepID=UPI00147E588D|nr:hypothetical protein [Ruegeria lacuscaerulensis]
MKKNLVVVRAGNNSLHHRWQDLPLKQRDYDLLVSYFSDDAFAAFTPQPGVEAVLIKGGKWDGLYKTLSDRDLDQYDFIWLPDDDLDISAQDVNALFQAMRTHGLRIAQPSLTLDSYYSHFVFSRCPGFVLRYINYIEIMAPCLHRDVLKKALPLFQGTMSGYGLDYIWCRWAEAGAYRTAILDEIAMHHTRPVGKALKSAMAETGNLSSEQEEAVLKEMFDLTRRTVPIVFAGILQGGQPISGRVQLGWRMCKSWLSVLSEFRDRGSARSGILKIARRQVSKPLDMTTITSKQKGP